MKKLLTIMLLSAALGALSHPAPADAAAVQTCLNESLASCNSDFGGTSEDLAAIRGWCYAIRWGWCSWFD